ncbi:MAG TPA: hypothetical protein VFO15_18090 [Xanthobacteraceae bacterium]|nr:hypothetical protein [Xanthobacteraceae bacterium]
MIAAGGYELRNNEGRAVTHFAMCRQCTWQTAPTDDYERTLERARAHNERKDHVTEACTVHAVIIA